MIKKSNLVRSSCVMALAALALLGAGCASTTPTAKFKQPLSAAARLANEPKGSNEPKGNEPKGSGRNMLTFSGFGGVIKIK